MINEFKFVHKSGTVSCSTTNNPTFWGCEYYNVGMGLFLTRNNSNNIILPDRSDYRITSSSISSFYYAKNLNYNSAELRLFTSTPIILYQNEQLKLWYGEDLFNLGDFDNNGISCTDVYAVITSLPPQITDPVSPIFEV